jgi:hypothetical protein
VLFVTGVVSIVSEYFFVISVYFKYYRMTLLQQLEQERYLLKVVKGSNIVNVTMNCLSVWVMVATIWQIKRLVQQLNMYRSHKLALDEPIAVYHIIAVVIQSAA